MCEKKLKKFNLKMLGMLMRLANGSTLDEQNEKEKSQIPVKQARISPGKNTLWSLWTV